MWSSKKNLQIEISGRSSIEGIKTMFFEIYSLMFIYMGGFPRLIRMEINGESLDISSLADRFETSSQFRKASLVLCPINGDTINESTVQRYRCIAKMHLFSLQYLVSQNYEKINIAHKITLALHVVDGVVDESVSKNYKSEIKRRYKIPNVGNYYAKVYFLCKTFFFTAHRKSRYGILSLLNTSQKNFIQVIVDTRNWYSHFLPESLKPDKLKEGSAMIKYLEIVCYLIRMQMLDSIGVKRDKERMDEYFYTIHDWLIKTCPGKEISYKSRTYRSIKSVEMMRKMFKDTM